MYFEFYLSKVPLPNEILEHFVLVGSLQGHQVHAPLPAQVASVQPTHLVALYKQNKIIIIHAKKCYMWQEELVGHDTIQ